MAHCKFSLLECELLGRGRKNTLYRCSFLLVIKFKKNKHTLPSSCTNSILKLTNYSNKATYGTLLQHKLKFLATVFSNNSIVIIKEMMKDTWHVHIR